MKLFDTEFSDDHSNIHITDDEIKLIVDMLHELGFKCRYIVPSSKKEGDDIEFIDVYYKTPVMFTDTAGRKYLIPNFKKTEPDKLRTKCCTINIFYNNMRQLTDPEGVFKNHLSLDYRFYGAYWRWERKDSILGDYPEGIKRVYDYGRIPDHLETIKNSFVVLKNYLDNGEDYPKAKPVAKKTTKKRTATKKRK